MWLILTKSRVTYLMRYQVPKAYGYNHDMSTPNQLRNNMNNQRNIFSKHEVVRRKIFAKPHRKTRDRSALDFAGKTSGSKSNDSRIVCT